MRRPRLLVLSLGADTAFLADGMGGHGARARPAGMAALSAIAEVEAQAPLRLPSASLSPAHLVQVAQRIEDAFANGFDGAVVTQGTDTLEESAFILDLLLAGDRPIVVTGAPEPGDAPGLVAAARVAASPEACGLGALVVVQEEIHSARFVEQARTGHAAAFVSPVAGPIGVVAGGQPRFWARVPRLPCLPSYGGPPRPVALLRWTMGDDGRWLGSLPVLGYAGAVIEGLGAGRVPPQAAPLLGELAATMPVVLAAHDAPGPLRISDAGAGEAELLQRGLIAAGCLSGPKARLLLGFALRGTTGHAAAAAAFAPYQ
ncbi:asparaginase domain-containing protein [Falsiroseomonas oryzae]|uniref:asparaginase domain-containing protein n=1 Tax=Falsiroseomonas oryzae TaxID=2766473 RepID=UPI0022EAD605|nr:asparaginase domain-containing protein [Roseomonas sp. MO-31]